METLSHHELTVFSLSLSLGVLLCSARGLGELARHYHQPTVVGEIMAGILLGPTTLAIVLFLLVAGMEVALSSSGVRVGPL